MVKPEFDRVVAAGPGGPRPAPGARRTLSDLLSLTKPGITGLVVATTAAGAYLASIGSPSLLLLLHTLIGTALLAGGTNALNQYVERELDGRMYRTRIRPLPSGRLAAGLALAFAVAISLVGAVYLALAVNLLTAGLGVLALVSYIAIYTPLKTRTSLCTVIGAVPGAIPPMMGWTAVRGELDVLAWTLFAIVFLWQLPHFLAIAWICRDDYARAGFPMLPVQDPQGVQTGRQIVLYSLALVPVSLLTSVLGLTGALYFFGALSLSLAFLGFGVRAALTRSTRGARRLFLASVVYLPALLGLMVLDKL